MNPLPEEDWGLGYIDTLPGINSMHHCEKARALVVVLSDGSCALLSMQDTQGLTQLQDIAFSHWVCSPQMSAICARIGASAQMIAVGNTRGHLALFRLHPTMGSASSLGPEGCMPVRTLSMEPWGHKGNQTGGVSQVEWAPDCRAIAVGYMRQGLVVWSPSGCRLMCSLRQVPNQYGRDSLTGSLRSGVDDLPSAASLSRQVSMSPPELDSVGVSQLAWGPQGYSLTVANTGCSWQLSEVQFARSLPRHHRVSHAGPGWLASACTSTSTSALPGPGLGGPSTQHTMHGGQPLGEELHVLQAHDRLLVIGEALQTNAGGPGPVTGRPNTRHGNLTSVGSGDAGAVQPASDLVVSHVALPHQYINANWPIMHAAVSSSGMDMAVAGTHGLALYSRASDRWRLFGDISQERRVACCSLSWLMDGIVLVCSGPRTDVVNRPATDPTSYELLLFPRYHLDFGSLLCRVPLTQPPLAVDCVGSHVLIAHHIDPQRLEIALYEVTVRGHLSPLGKPSASLQLVREVSTYMSHPLLNLALVPASPAPHPLDVAQFKESMTAAAGAAGDGRLVAGLRPPKQCVLLRWGGLMSAFDLETGVEVPLATEVEAFWLSDSMPVGPLSSAPSLSTVPSMAGGMDALGGVGGGAPGSVHVTLSAPMAGASSSIVNIPGQVAAITRQLALGHLISDPRTLTPQQQAQLGRHLQPVLSHASMASGMSGACGHDQMSPSGLLADSHACMQWSPSQAQLLMPLEVAGVEMPWWSYGPQGMQLWFPSSLAQGAVSSPLDRNQQQQAAAPQDIELEFDQEVYPVGISLADAAIVGVTQRITRNPSLQGRAGPAVPGSGTLASPCFLPVPESQPVLPCLLRRLLQRGAFADALLLARRHEHGPHFSRSLEWLLFTALEMETSRPLAKRNNVGAGNDTVHLGRVPAGDSHLNRSPGEYGQSGLMVPISVSPLLMAAADLVASFPALSADVVVAVARKTDAQLWPALFSAVGAPSVLLEGLMEEGALVSAACFLLVIDRLEGAGMAHTQALRLMRAALKNGVYPLVGELLRFIIPPCALDTTLSGAPSEIGSPTEWRTPAASPTTKRQRAAEGSKGGAPPVAPQPAQQQGFFGWLFGWGAPSTGAGQGQQASGARRTASTGGRGNVNVNGAAGLGSGPTSAHHLEHMDSTASEGLAPASDCLRMIGDAAWMLLEAGRLGALVQLSASVSFLQGGLAGLMAAHPPPSCDTVPSRLTAPSAVELLSSLALAVTEFPVWQGASVEADALAALDLVKALGATAWVVVLSVVLVNMAEVAVFVEAHPQVWEEFMGMVRADKTFTYLHHIIDAVTPPATPTPHSYPQVPLGGALAEGEAPHPPPGVPTMQEAGDKAGVTWNNLRDGGTFHRITS